MRPLPALAAGVRAVAALLLGLLVGLASVAVHPLWGGLALAVAATLVTALALPRGWTTRLPYAAGWLGLLWAVVRPRPEGGFLLADSLQGYLLLGLALVLLVLCVVTLPRPTGRATTRASRPAP